MIISQFKTDKAVQAASAILRRQGGRMSRLRLVKLLYIANRKMLQQHGRPIFVAKAVAMKHGPVHSEVYDLVNGRRMDEERWSRHIRNLDSKTAELHDDPGIGLLSVAEVDALNEAVDDFAKCDDWDVVDLTHQFPEWKDNFPNPMESTSRPIPIRQILAAVGRDDDAPDIIQDIADDAEFDRLFSS